MKIISNKKRNRWAMFLIITGILNIYLSFVYATIESFENPLFLYFLMNSIILVVLGGNLKYKKSKTYNILLILLFSSVAIGWLFAPVQFAVLSGFLIVAYFGGPIIIPLFHIAIIGSFISSIRRLQGKVKYEYETDILLSEQPSDQIISSSYSQDFQRKKSRKIRIFYIVLPALLLFFLIIIRPTLVLDSKTFLPINDATIEYEHNDLWNGCGDDTQNNTILGISASSFDSASCKITVKKNGYHTNGANRRKILPGVLGLRIIKLNKINNPQENFVQFNRMFTKEYPSMDVSAYVSNLNQGLNPNQNKNDTNIDFTFTVIGNEAKEVNHIGRSILHMEFFGEGGVQPISKDSTGSDAGAEYYDMENLLEAPIDGYKKTLDIEGGKAYIARLKDGKHYMKFHVFGSKDHSTGDSTACMTGYIQPLESRNLEFVDVYENIFCSNDSSENDNIYVIYSNLKKQLTGKNYVLYAGVIGNYIDQLGLRYNPNKYDFIALPNNNRFTNTADPISVSALRTMEVDVELPAFEIFRQRVPNYQQVPVDLFLNGKYLDPINIIED